MASTYTTSLKIQEIANGEQSGYWGTTTNTNWTLIEQAVAGVQSIVMSNADYTMTNLNGVSDEARNAVLVVTGTNSAIRKVIAPLNQPKLYVVSNQTTGGYAITIGASTGTYVTIPNGVTAQVYTDGTNFYSSQTGSAGDFNVSGNETIAGNMSVGGNTTLSGTLSVTGAASLTTGSISGIVTAPTAAVGTNTTQIATTAFVVANAVITGAIQMWPTNSAPTGYLICDGSAVSRTTYSALFAVIGTTFGAGDTTTTFNLPNYADRMAIGKGTIAASIGATGGSKDAIVVSHTHTATSVDSGHSHIYSKTTSPGGSGPDALGSAVNDYTATGYANITTTIASTGSSGTDANLPPYLGINFIIKT